MSPCPNRTEKFEKISSIIESGQFSSLKSRKSRDALANQICDAVSFWSFSEIRNFVDEMDGLNLRNREDQKVFVLFLSQWMDLCNQEDFS